VADETLPAEVRIRYESGNAHAPVGNGSIRIDVHHDNSVRLTNDRHGNERTWLGWIEPEFVAAFDNAVAKAGFPTAPSVMTAPPGTRSISLTVRRDDGAIEVASGFPSPEYKDVSLLFNQIVGQMSGSAVLGFVPESAARFVRDSTPAY
jgi:hypothetical protein